MGMNGISGLDYGAVALLARLYEIDLTPGLMLKIRALEIKVLEKAYKNPEGKGGYHGG